MLRVQPASLPPPGNCLAASMMLASPIPRSGTCETDAGVPARGRGFQAYSSRPLPQCELSAASVAHASVPFAIPDRNATCPACSSSSPKNLTASSLSAARGTDRVGSARGTRFAFRPPGPRPPPAASSPRPVLFAADSTVVFPGPALAAASAQPGGPRAALRLFPVPMPGPLYGPHAAFGARGSSCRRAGVPFGPAVAKIRILYCVDLCTVAPGPRPGRARNLRLGSAGPALPRRALDPPAGRDARRPPRGRRGLEKPPAARRPPEPGRHGSRAARGRGARGMFKCAKRDPVPWTGPRRPACG